MDELYVSHGRIASPRGREIAEPAVLVDGAFDVFLAWGEKGPMFAKCDEMNAKFAASGMDPTVRALSLAEMDADRAAYVLLRMMRYSASGFVKEFTEKFESGSGVSEWLDAEIARVPIGIPSSPAAGA